MSMKVVLESHGFQFMNGVYVEVHPNVFVRSKTDFKYYIGNNLCWEMSFDIPFSRKAELKKVALETVKRQQDLQKGEKILLERHSMVLASESGNAVNVVFKQVDASSTIISIGQRNIKKKIPISRIAELKEEAIKLLKTA